MKPKLKIATEAQRHRAGKGKIRTLCLCASVAMALLCVAADFAEKGRKISQYMNTNSLGAGDMFVLERADGLTNINATKGDVFSQINTQLVSPSSNNLITIINNASNSLRTNPALVVSPPLSSVQYNSNNVFSGSSLFVFTNSQVGIGTNAPQYPLHIFASDITKPAQEISYASGAGNTVALQIRNGTGATNFQVEVSGLMRSATIHNSGAITGASATVTALAVTGGTLGAGKVLTDVSGTGAATWEAATGGGADGVWTNNAGVIHPKVSNGQQTNSIQIYTNGALAIGLGTLDYWGVPTNGETWVSLRDTNIGERAWNETFLGLKMGTNLSWQNNFVNSNVTRRLYTIERFGTALTLDEYASGEESNFVYRAYNSNGADVWHFTATGAGASNDTRYTFNGFGPNLSGPVPETNLLFLLQNDSANKFEVYGGDGNVNITGQITNQFLTASKLILTDTGKGFVSSAFGETDLEKFATTNFVNSAISNATLVGDNLGNHIATNRLFLSTNGQTAGGLPALAFGNDPDLGMQWDAANALAFIAQPSTKVTISGSGAYLRSSVPIQAPQTGAGNAGFTFDLDNDTGFRNFAADTLDTMVGGAVLSRANPAAVWQIFPFTNQVRIHAGLYPWRFETNGNFEVFTNGHLFAWTEIAVAGTITLPNANTCSNFICVIKDQGGNAAATNVTITGVGATYTNLIDGATTILLDANYEVIRLYSAGRTNWYTR